MEEQEYQGKLASTVTWEVRSGEVERAAAIIARFVPEARKEPGLELLVVSQDANNSARFLFFEIFSNQAAFEAHQEMPHFRTMIMQEALPLLAHRERLLYTIL